MPLLPQRSITCGRVVSAIAFQTNQSINQTNMSNLFFYQYLVLTENLDDPKKPYEIIVSGLVGATDRLPLGAIGLMDAIKSDVTEQGYSEDEIYEGRLLSIERV